MDMKEKDPARFEEAVKEKGLSLLYLAAIAVPAAGAALVTISNDKDFSNAVDSCIDGEPSCKRYLASIFRASAKSFVKGTVKGVAGVADLLAADNNVEALKAARTPKSEL